MFNFIDLQKFKIMSMLLEYTSTVLIHLNSELQIRMNFLYDEDLCFKTYTQLKYCYGVTINGKMKNFGMYRKLLLGIGVEVLAYRQIFFWG